MVTDNKRGISLTVLVITIIVLIILASSIILSVSNSEIIGKANKAQNDSNDSNLKEYVKVLKAEYELMPKSQKRGKSRIQYVNERLKENGYKRRLNENGILLTENAVSAIDAGLKIGDEVDYIITTSNEYTPDSTKTGTTNGKLTSKTDLTWIYIGVGNDGDILISPDVSSGVLANSDVMLYGITGWIKGPKELDKVCYNLYTVEGKGIARSMNIDDITRLLGYTGERGAYYSNTYTPTAEPMTIAELEAKLGTLSNRKTPTKPGGVDSDLGEYKSDYYSINKTGADVKEMKYSGNIKYVYPSSGTYWLASQCVAAYFDEEFAYIRMRFVGPDYMGAYDLFRSYGNEYGTYYAIRPVVSLKSAIQKGTESEGNVWTLISQ